MEIRTSGDSAELLRELLETYLAMMRGASTAISLHSARYPMPVSEDDVFAVWRQFTWELVVERPLADQNAGLVLAAYDGDADWWEESMSVRVLNPDALPTHEVRLLVAEGARELVDGGTFGGANLRFEGFADVSSGWPLRSGTGLHAVVEDGESMKAFDLADVVFFLAPL